MSDKYAPGTHAKATVRGAKNVEAVYIGQSLMDGVGYWCSVPPVCSAHFHAEDQVTDVRPLVVIDPHDGDALDAFTDAVQTYPTRRAADVFGAEKGSL